MLTLDLTIRTYGWQLTQVTDTNPWSYTIGLTESYGHPELMIVGLELDLQNTVIRKIVDPIVETGQRRLLIPRARRGHAGRGAPESSRRRLVRNLVELLRAHPAAGFVSPDRAPRRLVLRVSPTLDAPLRTAGSDPLRSVMASPPRNVAF
jgi:hypothetical protein